MKLLPDGRYEITNKSTGEKKIVTEQELPSYGLTPEKKGNFFENMVKRSVSPSILNLHPLTSGMKTLGIKPTSYMAGLGSTQGSVGAGLGAMAGKGMEAIDVQTRPFMGAQGIKNIGTLLKDPNLGKNIQQELKTAPERLGSFATDVGVAGGTAATLDAFLGKVIRPIANKVLGPLGTKIKGLNVSKQLTNLKNELWNTKIAPALESTGGTTKTVDVSNIVTDLLKMKEQYGAKGSALTATHRKSVDRILDEFLTRADDKMMISPTEAEEVLQLLSPLKFNLKTGAEKTLSTVAGRGTKAAVSVAGEQTRKGMTEQLVKAGYGEAPKWFEQYAAAANLSNAMDEPLKNLLWAGVAGQLARMAGVPWEVAYPMAIATITPAGKEATRQIVGLPMAAVSSQTGKGSINALLQQFLGNKQEEFKYGK